MQHLCYVLQVELTSESDLFFHYTHTTGPAAFRQLMQEAQKLMVDFNDYPSVFLRMLNSCIQAPQNHIAVLLMEHSGLARMDFIQVALNAQPNALCVVINAVKSRSMTQICC